MKTLTLSEDELITVELAVSITIARVSSTVPKDLWPMTSLSRLEELRAKITQSLYNKDKVDGQSKS